jgi:hypothetical protein
MRGRGFLGSRNKTVFLAVAVLVIAFFVWTQNAVDNSTLILLAAVALLVVALAGTVSEAHEGGEGGAGGHEEEEPIDFGGHPEAFEEEVHETPAGH